MCLFCNIIEKKVAAEIIKEDNDFIAFRDIRPKALTHILIVPKKHTSNFQTTPYGIIAGMSDFIKDFARNAGLANNYNLQINNGASAGQEIMHFHCHLLSGQGI